MMRSLVQRCLGFLDLRLYRPRKAQRARDRWLSNIEVKTILDIGANAGQFAQQILRIFPEATIYSFEPLKDCYEQLVKTLGGSPRVRAFNVALGERKEQREILRNEFSPSSSFLAMAETHKAAFPFTQRSSPETVEVVRLDDFVSDLEVRKPLLIKMDVQGFEDKVISGGADTIRRADVVIVEVSMIGLYDGQPLFAEIHGMMTNLGFKYRGNWDQLMSPLDGHILQADAIFMKASPL
jgi:FkbM family methyltransferase